jgi:hypothetical protein
VLAREPRAGSGRSNGFPEGEALRERLGGVVGEVLAERIVGGEEKGVVGVLLDGEGLV